jgi:hypothetical protein
MKCPSVDRTVDPSSIVAVAKVVGSPLLIDSNRVLVVQSVEVF